MHAVGQVCPPQLGVVHLLLQHLICAVSHNPRDVIILHSNHQALFESSHGVSSPLPKGTKQETAGRQHKEQQDYMTAVAFQHM